MLITFSGLDGAGKTTLIRALKAAIEKGNLTVTVLSMYDDVALYSFFRSFRDRIKGRIHALRGQRPDAGVVSQERRDDGTAAWFAQLLYGVVRSPVVKRWVYFLDLLIFLVLRVQEERIKKNVVILDRYFYDSMADVAGRGWLGWLYIRLFLFITPTPDMPVFVNVSAEEAFARKAEYPLHYLKQRQVIYQRIFQVVSRPVIISTTDLNVTLHALEGVLAARIKEER